MSDDLKHVRECIDNARYWLGQAILATRKAKETEKNKTILDERCAKIKSLCDCLDKLVINDFGFVGYDESEVIE